MGRKRRRAKRDEKLYVHELAMLVESAFTVPPTFLSRFVGELSDTGWCCWLHYTWNPPKDPCPMCEDDDPMEEVEISIRPLFS